MATQTRWGTYVQEAAGEAVHVVVAIDVRSAAGCGRASRDLQTIGGSTNVACRLESLQESLTK